MAERKSTTHDRNQARQRMMQKAYDLYVHEKMSLAAISVELGVSTNTVGNYLKRMGVQRREVGRPVTEAPDPISKFETFLDAAASGEVKLKTHKPADVEETYHARKEEEASIERVANDNMSSSDKYCAYVAGQGMRIMRDALPHIKKPTNVKEFEILDTIIRRSLGLGTGKGGGNGKIRIDVNILNNSKASPKGAIVDIED